MRYPGWNTYISHHSDRTTVNTCGWPALQTERQSGEECLECWHPCSRSLSTTSSVETKPLSWSIRTQQKERWMNAGSQGSKTLYCASRLLSMPEEQLIKNEASNPKRQALPIWISGFSIGLANSSRRDTQLQLHHSVVFLTVSQPAHPGRCCFLPALHICSSPLSPGSATHSLCIGRGYCPSLGPRGFIY